MPVPILSARITLVQAAFPSDPDCVAETDVTLTPATPSVSIDIGCTFVTIALEGNAIVATREPPGSSNFFVAIPEIVIDVPASLGAYLPLVVTQMPGLASRIRPVSQDGDVYASGGSYPNCDCSYTFPAISGEALTFLGGRFVSRADRHEFLAVSARVPRPGLGKGRYRADDSD